MFSSLWIQAMALGSVRGLMPKGNLIPKNHPMLEKRVSIHHI